MDEWEIFGIIVIFLLMAILSPVVLAVVFSNEVPAQPREDRGGIAGSAHNTQKPRDCAPRAR